MTESIHSSNHEAVCEKCTKKVVNEGCDSSYSSKESEETKGSKESHDSEIVEMSGMPPLHRPETRESFRQRGKEANAEWYTENNLYGKDADEDLIRASRAETRATLASADIGAYREESEIDVQAKDNVGKDGVEFEDLDPELVTWDGEEDPENPRNWGRGKKAWTTFLVALITVLPPMTSSVLSPAVPRILETYHNSNKTVGSLMVSIMLLAWGLFSLLMGPFSEVFGRKNVLLFSSLGGMAFNLACAWSPTSATMLVFRFLGGAFNCAPLAVGAGSLADLYNDEDRAWPLAWWGLGPSLGPVIAPIISGFIARYGDWRWVFWSIAIFQFFLTVFAYIFLRESYGPTLLARKRARLIKESGNTHLHTIYDVSAEGNDNFIQKLRLAVVRPVLFLFTNPVVFGLSLHLAYVYAFMYLLLVTFPDLWQEKYHYSVSISGLMYIGLGLGIFIGICYWTPIMKHHMVKRKLAGRGTPEDKVYFLPVASVQKTIALIWYGWSAQARIHWIMPEIGVAIFGAGLFCVFQAVQSYIVELNPRLAGSAISAAVLGRCLAGTVFPLFGHAMYDRLGYGWANTLIGLLLLVIGVPFPIAIYRYGAKMRAWSDAHNIVV